MHQSCFQQAGPGMILVRLLLVLTVCFWGWSFVATKICLDYMTPIQVIGLRYILGLPIMMAVLVGKRRRFEIERKDYGTFAAAAIEWFGLKSEYPRLALEGHSKSPNAQLFGNIVALEYPTGTHQG